MNEYNLVCAIDKWLPVGGVDDEFRQTINST